MDNVETLGAGEYPSVQEVLVKAMKDQPESIVLTTMSEGGEMSIVFAGLDVISAVGISTITTNVLTQHGGEGGPQ